jgi:hypothetical protein
MLSPVSGRALGECNADQKPEIRPRRVDFRQHLGNRKFEKCPTSRKSRDVGNTRQESAVTNVGEALCQTNQGKMVRSVRSGSPYPRDWLF